VSDVWLEWGEPTHDLCILVGRIEVTVVAAYYVPAVDIAVTDADRSVGHGILSKTSDQRRGSTATYRGSRGFANLSGGALTEVG